MITPDKKSLCAWVLLFSVTALLNNSAIAGPILANSLADWNAATSDGIDINGNAVIAGSSNDAAQQGHAATSNGIWNYKGTNGPATGTFSTSPGFYGIWSNAPGNGGSSGCYQDAPGFCRTGATTMQPRGTFNGNTWAVREWIGSGLAGETVRISGSFDTLHNTLPVSTFNNGVNVIVLLNQSFELFNGLLLPGESTSFDITATLLSPVANIRFAVGPQGPGPAVIGSQDFFNDSTRFSAEIELLTADVSEPPTLMLLLGPMLLMMRRRRPKFPVR